MQGVQENKLHTKNYPMTRPIFEFSYPNFYGSQKGGLKSVTPLPLSYFVCRFLIVV